MLTQLNTMSYFKKVLAKSSADSLAAWQTERGHNTPLIFKCVFFCVRASAFYDDGRKEILGSAGFFWFQSANLSFRHHHNVLAGFGDDLIQNQKRSAMTTSIDILDITNTRDTLLIQAHAIASVISNNENLTEMPSEYITNALWCVSEHLEQIQKLNLKLDQVVRTNCDVRAL